MSGSIFEFRKNRDVETDGLFSLAVEPQERGDFLNAVVKINLLGCSGTGGLHAMRNPSPAATPAPYAPRPHAIRRKAIQYDFQNARVQIGMAV